MNTFINADSLTEYLGDVFDTEINLFIQNRLLSRMINTEKSLANPKTFREPLKKEAVFESYNMFIVGIVAGIITAVVTFIAAMGFEHGFFGFLNALWRALVFGLIGAAAGTVTLGLGVAVFTKQKNQRSFDQEFQKELAVYKANVDNDKLRVNKELEQKKRLKKEMELLRKRIAESRQNLKKMYDYDVIDKDYRNIYAVSSFYGYLKKGRTHSLGFNGGNGDQGAYNIYENERRLDLIITNTDEILNKLNEVSKNQFVLAEGLRNAQSQIAYLGNEVSGFISQAQSSLENIENSQAMIEYNTRRTADEAGFLKWMAIFSE